MLLHDLTFAEQRGAQVRIWAITALVGVAFLAAALCRFSSPCCWLAGGCNRCARQSTRPGSAGGAPTAQESPRSCLRRTSPPSAAVSRKRAERTTEGPDVDWSPDTLRRLLAQKLPNAEMIVVSNREPYIHLREGRKIPLQKPASGLVAAIEPVMRACGGTWIAHGSGAPTGKRWTGTIAPCTARGPATRFAASGSG